MRIRYDLPMAFACNIDRKGRRARWISGVVIVMLSLAIGELALRDGAILFWILAGVLFLIGAFSVFEGTIGWCALRAMGIKTKV